MHHGSGKFLAILRVELEDLMLDLKDAEEMYRRRFSRGDVSGYVLMENTVVLENELAGVKAVIHELESVDAARYASLEELCEEVHRVCAATVKRIGVAEALVDMMSRKCAKVRRYLSQDG